MSRAFLLVIAFLALIYTTSAHPQHGGRRSLLSRAKRDVQSSTCAFMQCAVSHGNCGLSGSTLQFCPSGEHCDGTNCVDNVALGNPCNPNAPENECAKGTCVDTGAGPKCQIYHDIMPGNPCNVNSECYYSANGDGSDSGASTCDQNTKTCYGKNVNEDCLADNQCVVGHFCNSGKKCQAYGNNGDSCESDSQCNDRLTCFSGKCSARYTQAQGQSCSSTENCQSGLYCKAGSCAAVKSSSSGSSCDIASNNCPADEQCSCSGFQTGNQVASCSAISGTPNNMASVETSAFSCMDKFQCGSDTSNATTVACLANNCAKEYCTYVNNELSVLSQFPTCLVSRMVGSQDYFALLQKCKDIKPDGDDNVPPKNSGSSLSASFAWIALVSLAVFFFEF